MGRSPCCDETGLKKGPWTPEEDQKLAKHIQKHGHGSWRALPKLAGRYTIIFHISVTQYICLMIDLYMYVCNIYVLSLCYDQVLIDVGRVVD